MADGQSALYITNLREKLSPLRTIAQRCSALRHQRAAATANYVVEAEAHTKAEVEDAGQRLDGRD